MFIFSIINVAHRTALTAIERYIKTINNHYGFSNDMVSIPMSGFYIHNLAFRQPNVVEYSATFSDKFTLICLLFIIIIIILIMG